MKTWKQELDAKYRKLLATGNSHIIDKANEVILDSIDKLDIIIKNLTEKKES